MNQTAYSGSPQNNKAVPLKSQFNEFINHEKSMIEDGIKSITDNTSFQKLASELSSLNKKTMKYVRDNPILVAGAVIGLGVAGFATYKLLKGSSEIAKESVSHS